MLGSMIDMWSPIPPESAEELAERVLRNAGIKHGQTVLDFGCGIGAYTIPAARIVGPDAVVYALDEDESKIHRLRTRAQAAGVQNIRVLPPVGRAVVKLSDRSADVILLYDVLHSWYHPQPHQREAILHELFRILRADGCLSFYPGDPEVFGNRAELEKILHEFSKVGFLLQQQNEERLVHEKKVVRGHVFRYEKSLEAHG